MRRILFISRLSNYLISLIDRDAVIVTAVSEASTSSDGEDLLTIRPLDQFNTSRRGSSFGRTGGTSAQEMAARVGYFSVMIVTFLVGLLSAKDSNSTQEPPLCVCVWYYLCTEGTINTDGTGIINPRTSLDVSCNEVGQICCPFEQMKNNTGLSAAPIQESTTPSVEENEAVSGEIITTPAPAPSDRINATEPITNIPDEGATKPIVVIEDNPKPVAHPVIVPKPGCGVKRVSLQKRISFSSLGESLAQYAEFPWMLAILTDENSSVYKFHCGASLIHRQIALTAAHCVDSFRVETLHIRAGEWSINSTEEPEPHQDRTVSHIELHPFYDRARLRHDIALIFLESPLNLTKNVDTICLPGPDDLFHGTMCSVTGWGKDPKSTHGTFNNILHKVDVPVVTCTECENRLRKTRLGPLFKLHSSALCAGGEPDKDSCKGDGGGPLICPTDEDNRYVQAGIVSWGIGCGTTNPGVYTDVSLHSGWIQRSIDRFEQVQINLNRFPSDPYNHFSSSPQSQTPHYPNNHVPNYPHNHVPNYPHNHVPNYPHNQVPNYPHNHYPNHHDFSDFEPY